MLLRLVNDHLVADYAAVNAPSADVAAAFASYDFDTLVTTEKWGVIPINVANACTWLDIICRVGQPEGFGDDANAAGYRVIADAFIKIIVLNPTTPTSTSTSTSTTSTTAPGSPPDETAVSPEAVAVVATPTFTG
jgi:hypothetical protein